MNHPHSPLRRGTAFVTTGIAVGILILLFWQSNRAQQLEAANEAIRTAEQTATRRAQLIVLSTPSALVMFDENQIITMVNPAAEELLGWPAAELLGQSIEIIVPEDLRESHRQRLQECQETLREQPQDWLYRLMETKRRVLRRDGSEVVVEIGLRAIRSGGRCEFIKSFHRLDIPLEPPVSEPLPTLDQTIQQMSLK